MITLSVDCMGGDHGPHVTLAACRRFLETHEDAQLLLVGLPEALSSFSHPRARVVAAAEVVAMDDPIEVALRRKKNSSMRVAIEQIKDGSAQAAVSAGNTGALMAIARYVLKTMDGIDRPAIAGRLLNIGEEAIKGNEVIKKTSELLRSAANSGDLNFYGNVEGNDIYQGTVNLIVCDGFVGNVALKASEGLAHKISETLKNSFTRNILTKIAALVSYPVLSDFKDKVDHRRYNGAALLGLNGIVFKSHGSADEVAFETALNRAYDAAHHNLLERVRSRIAHAAPLLRLG
jgi:phosphate acyltransferase